MDSMVSWINDTGDMPDLVVNDYEIPLLGAFLFYFVQVTTLNVNKSFALHIVR
jgi:hypothetical protein